MTNHLIVRCVRCVSRLASGFASGFASGPASGPASGLVGLRSAGLALSLLFAGSALAQTDQSPPAAAEPATPSRIAVGVPAVQALPAVVEKVAGYGQQNELAQIVEGLDAKLSDALQNTRKFEVRAHGDLAKILKEQGDQDSGNYDLTDPKRAKPFKLAGIPYLTVVQIDDFQDQVQTANFEGVGQKATRRQIRLSAVCRIYDVTKGTLLESARLTLTDFDFKNNPQYVVDQKGGDLTEAVINVIADRMANRIAQRVTDVIFPAKVLVVRDGVVTLNRGEGTEIAVGEIWEAFAQGEELIDPDTGESLGSEEVAIGFVRVISVAPKFSRAEVCGVDRGVAKNTILRKTARTSCGSDAQAPRMFLPAAVLPEETRIQQGDAAPPIGAGRKPTDGPAVPPVAARGQSDATPERRPVAAIFVRNRERRIDDDKVMMFEDYLVGELDGACFATMSREDSLNAVKAFAGKGANAGSGSIDPVRDLDKILSDSTSAVSLAQSMGADYVLVASITALSVDRRRLNDPARGVQSEVESYRLDASYRILGRAEGATIATGVASASDSVRQTPDLSIERDIVTDLLRESAGKMAAAMKKRCEKSALPAPESLVAVPLEIDAASSDFTIPEIVKDQEGRWTIASGSFKLQPTDFLVEIDGLVVGSTPNPVKATKGLRKIRVSRPDFETFEGTINVQPGTGPIRIAMKLTDAGLARVAEMTAFFQELKQAQQLADAEVKVLEGYAEFFRNSKFAIDISSAVKSESKSDTKIDTKEAPVFKNNSFWQNLPWGW
jgi:curli biogenesis system outer membrane secretion channel CsgG